MIFWKLHELGENELGFGIVNYTEQGVTDLSARLLWDAWNTALKHGKPVSDGISLVLDDLGIHLHQAGGAPGSRHGMTIARNSLFQPIFPEPKLRNGTLVLWDKTISVPNLRGAIG